MANSFFQFRQFIIHQNKCAMKVTTDACLFGAIVARSAQNMGESRALDIGTGTGLLSLMVAQQNHALQIDAVEIDPDAAKQAQQNILLSSWNDKIRVINEDITRMAHENKYDLIFSNPPFYEREILSSDYRRNVAHHQGGLDLKTLFPLVAGSLNDKGQFWLLLPFKREREILQILSLQNMFVNSIFFMRQTVDHDYFRMIIHGAKSDLQNNPMTQDLAIKDHAGNYTAEFISLLKDYYLHL